MIEGDLSADAPWLIDMGRMIYGEVWRAAQLLVCTVRYRQQLQSLSAAPSNSQLGRLRAKRPELYGMVLTPFMTANWQAKERFNALRTHCEIADRLGTPFDLGDDEHCEIFAFNGLEPLTRVILNTRRWRQRDGLLTLHLCTADATVFALSFILSEKDGRTAAIIGGIQGANHVDAVDLNRRLTKVAHGMRPKDLLIEVFRSLCRAIGIEQIMAVSDANRNQRSKYSLIRERGRDRVHMSYDVTWVDRGGVPDGNGFFDLPVQSDRRTDDEVPSNKRSMYRRRYAMLDAIDKGIHARFVAGLRTEHSSMLGCDMAKNWETISDTKSARGSVVGFGVLT